jgi:hypothetical protein
VGASREDPRSYCRVVVHLNQADVPLGHGGSLRPAFRFGLFRCSRRLVVEASRHDELRQIGTCLPPLGWCWSTWTGLSACSSARLSLSVVNMPSIQFRADATGQGTPHEVAEPIFPVTPR